MTSQAGLSRSFSEEKEEVQPKEADSGKANGDDVVQISEVKVVVQDKGKGLMVFGKSVNSPAQKSAMANDHEASSSKVADKYHQPRWCPLGLTHTQKRKLQHLPNKEKKEQEAEKPRDEHFNKYRHVVPQGKAWQLKVVNQSAAGLVKLTPVTGQTGATNRLDCLGSLVRPVEPSTKQTAESAVPVSVSCDDEVPLVPPAKEDEELVDYETSPKHSNMEINVVHLSSDYFVVPKDEVAHLKFGPSDVVFHKPKESDNHLKALYMRGHINGKPISRMLADGGAIVNFMPYSLYTEAVPTG